MEPTRLRIIILTQEDHLYLPQPLATVCREYSNEIACIVTCPAMTLHGSAFKGVLRHVSLFGFKGTCILGYRMVIAKIKGRLLHPSLNSRFYSIQQVAKAFEIPFYHVSKIKDQQFQDILEKHKPDLLVSISCPQIIGKKIRARIPMGCINVHGAPLPKYRGMLPSFWVLQNGEDKTATTVHDLEAKLDDGDILIQKEVEIAPDETWDTLVRKTKAQGAQALILAIKQIKEGTVERKPNRAEDATYYSFPTAKDRKAFIRAGRRFF